MILVLLFGCNPLPDTVTMTGTVGDTPYGGGGVVGGATLEVLDDAHASADIQTADEAGNFSVGVPAGVPFFLVVSAEGYVPTTFSGTAGVYDFAAPEGYPWVASTAWVDTLRAEFSACPNVGAVGAIVAGEIRVNTPGAAYTTMPFEPSGTARVFDGDQVEYAACYLDDDGVSVADAIVAGATGRFAVFGVPSGPTVVDVRYTDPGGDVPVELYQFDAPEAGFVPLYPALVDVLY